MSAISGRTVEPARSANGQRHLLLALAIILARCGGELDATTAGSAPDAGAAAGSSTGGSFSAGGAGTSSTGGENGIQLVTSDGGILNCVCGFASDAPCDDGQLWRDIHELGVNTVGGSCGEDPDGGLGTIHGAIVFDSQGQAVGLNLLAKYRWPCRAGQTVHYSCTSGYE